MSLPKQNPPMRAGFAGVVSGESRHPNHTPKGAPLSHLKAVPDIGEGEIEGDGYALVPPGEYRLRFDTWTTIIMWGRAPKLALKFKILDFGEHFETTLYRWYNVKRLVGKPGKQGRYKIGLTSDLYRDYASLLGAPLRPDRIALTKLKPLVIVGAVETVSKDRSQTTLHQACQYSVIRELVRTEQ